MIRHLSLVLLSALACARLGAGTDPRRSQRHRDAADRVPPATSVARNDSQTKADDAADGSATAPKTKSKEAETGKKPEAGAATASTPATSPTPAVSADAAAAQAAKERDDAVLDRSQPDFTIVNLPTSLRLPRFKSAFRVTHRFTPPAGTGRLRRSARAISSGSTPAR